MFIVEFGINIPPLAAYGLIGPGLARCFEADRQPGRIGGEIGDEACRPSPASVVVFHAERRSLRRNPGRMRRWHLAQLGK